MSEIPGSAMGAEALTRPVTFLGMDAVEKIRPPKAYRLPELDERIRTARTRNEARLMHEARMAGVRTPCVYDLDLKRCAIVMERIDGPTVKRRLDERPEDANTVCKEIARAISRLHSAGICHGDLTTSNMIVCEDGGICLLDMSMGRSRAELEDVGIDLRLLERTFGSAHVDLPEAFEVFMDEYRALVPEPEAVSRKLDDIRNRGRYT